MIPYDVARCNGKGCTARYRCARYTSPGDPIGWQTYIAPALVGPDGCESLIDNNARKTERDDDRD